MKLVDLNAGYACTHRRHSPLHLKPCFHALQHCSELTRHPISCNQWPSIEQISYLLSMNDCRIRGTFRMAGRGLLPRHNWNAHPRMGCMQECPLHWGTEAHTPARCVTCPPHSHTAAPDTQPDIINLNEPQEMHGLFPSSGFQPRTRGPDPAIDSGKTCQLF